jgi:hypothetical protein
LSIRDPILFLDRIDSVPIANSAFDPQFLQWLWVLVDSLNENIGDIENSINFPYATSYTATQIASFQSDGTLNDGVILYDTTNNEYVGRISGVLVKFSTTAYP